jgi:AcrR family transcriptional regulator
MRLDLQPRAGPGGRDARNRIVKAASKLFYERGVNVTGVEELANVAEVSKRTIYRHFEGKDQLVATYLMHVEQEQLIPAEAGLEDGTTSPRERIRRLFDAPDESIAGPPRGCPYLNAVVEIADPSHPAHRFAADHKRRIVAKIASLAAEAGAASPNALAAQLALLFDGAAIQSLALGNYRPYVEAGGAAEVLIEAALP